MAKMPSAKRAANSRPLAEAPAWRMAGPFCGERTTVSGPRDPKCRPRCSILMHLGGVGEDAVLAVHHHGVGLPAIPERQAHLHELLGPVVALVGGGQLLAVVRRLVVVERGGD